MTRLASSQSHGGKGCLLLCTLLIATGCRSLHRVDPSELLKLNQLNEGTKVFLKDIRGDRVLVSGRDPLRLSLKDGSETDDIFGDFRVDEEQFMGKAADGSPVTVALDSIAYAVVVAARPGRHPWPWWVWVLGCVGAVYMVLSTAATIVTIVELATD